MGKVGNRSKEVRGRSWRRIAGAALLRFEVPAGDSEVSSAPGSGGARLKPRAPWSLRTAATLRPGQKGTKQLVAEYGERQVSVRYREDPSGRKRYKTAEIIVAEMDWDPPPGPDDRVEVRIAWEEEALRARVKQAGGRWRPETKTWEVTYRAVVDLGIEDRVVSARGC